ncbi:MAG TPA: hypothetical protein VLF17_01320 [Candidatus Nitrosotenuis sp.]|nr:hypothetical protein [Candidatus Nitrosotenuis sp.]
MKAVLDMLKKIFARLKQKKEEKSNDLDAFKESEKKKFEQEEMKEEAHQLELKGNYEQDEVAEESKD